METIDLNINTLRQKTALGRKNFEQNEKARELLARKNLNSLIGKRSEQILEIILDGLKTESERGNYKYHHPIIWANDQRQDWEKRRTYADTGGLIVGRQYDVVKITLSSIYKLDCFKHWAPKNNTSVCYMADDLKNITIEYLATRRAIQGLFKQVSDLSIYLADTYISVKDEKGHHHDVNFPIVGISWRD